MTFKGWPAAAIEFYVGLEADNSKSYWLAHKTVYEESVKGPFLALSEQVEREFGPLRLFRPYRDTRFSKDKTPYKTAGAASTESQGGAAYYVMVSAAGLYVGSGYYHLMPDQLERFRAAVGDNRTGPKLATAVAAARKQRYSVDARESLKRVPRGFDAESPRADLLRMKGLHVGREYGAPKWLHSAGALDRIVKAWRDAAPVNRWLDRHVGPSTAAPPEPDQRVAAVVGCAFVCGIAGFAGSDRELMDRMLRSIVHRGPDGQGMEIGTHFSIGMRRLAIVDVATGDQPLYSDDHNLALVFNGEIYNARELRRELERRGRRFVTDHSDTEVIFRGFEEWGTGVVDHLTGMFAFAISDEQRGELFLARDRLGIKPLYYVDAPGRFAFGSELKALFQDPNVRRQPDLGSVRRFILFRLHDDGEDTFFDGVKRLLPGHTMIVRPDGIVKIERYWNPTVNPAFASSRSDDDYALEFGEVWDRVVARHLISDVPVGVPLSGGLDSSGVVSTMARLRADGTDLHTDGLYTFSALYPGESIDESDYIHEVERAVGSIPHYAYPTLDDFWNEITEWIWYQEEPTIASAPYAYYSVYRLASAYVKVMVSGNGGDELLAGYIPYFRAYLSSALAQRQYAAGAREIVQGFDLYRKYFGQMVKARLPRFGGNEVTARELLEDGPAVAAHQFTAERNLNERLASDVLAYSTPDLLRYEDKNSMAFSIEARVPFLDHEMVEYIFGLPIDQKIKGGWNRAVYRNAMKGRMPEKNRLRRSKVGFTNPDITWMKARAGEIREIFGSRDLASRGIYNRAQLVRAWDEYLAGRPGDGLIFWRVLVTELWMRRYIDGAVLV